MSAAGAGGWDRLVDPVLQGGDPRRRVRRAGPAGTGRAPGRHRGRPARPGGRRCSRRWPRPAAWTTSARSASAASSTAWSAWTRPARWSVRRCSGTTPGRPQAAADLVAELGAAVLGRRRWAASRWPRSPSPSCAGWPSTSRTNAGRTAAVCLPHDWLSWRLARQFDAGIGLDGLITDRVGRLAAPATSTAGPTQYRTDLLAGALGQRGRAAPGARAGRGRRPDRPAGRPAADRAGAGDNAAGALGRAGRRRTCWSRSARPGWPARAASTPTGRPGRAGGRLRRCDRARSCRWSAR